MAGKVHFVSIHDRNHYLGPMNTIKALKLLEGSSKLSPEDYKKCMDGRELFFGKPEAWWALRRFNNKISAGSTGDDITSFDFPLSHFEELEKSADMLEWLHDPENLEEDVLVVHYTTDIKENKTRVITKEKKVKSGPFWNRTVEIEEEKYEEEYVEKRIEIKVCFNFQSEDDALRFRLAVL